ncbi:MAG: outer membrane protein assembly factor BamA [Planctomycetota bacterium]
MAIPLLITLLLGHPLQEAPRFSKVTIAFQGNKRLTDRELQRVAVDELADFEKRGWRRAEVDDAAFQMETLYREKGFPFASVSYTYLPNGDRLTVTFVVEEGPRTTIDQITFLGLQAFDRLELQGFFGMPSPDLADRGTVYYVEQTVMSAPAAIAALYRIRGYLDVTIQKPEVGLSMDRSLARITVKIDEGPQYTIHTFAFRGNDRVSTQRLMSAVQEFIGAPYYPRRVYELKARIEELYGEEGFPEALIELERDPTGDRPEVGLTVRITEGPRVRIRDIITIGNEKTSQSFIENRLQLERGRIYRRSADRESFKSLYQTGLFSEVSIGLSQGEEERELLIAVKENPSIEFSTMAGYGSYEKLRGGIGFKERNIFGTGRILRIDTEASLVGESVVAGVTDPWLFGSDIVLDIPVYYRRRAEPSFTLEEIGGGLVLSREWTESFSTLLGYQLRRTNTPGEDVEAKADIVESSLRIGSITFEPAFDTRDDLFNPTRGRRLALTLEYAGESLASELSFWSTKAELAQLVPLREGTVFAFGLRTGYIVPLEGTTEIPLQLRFFNGGASTVRSFRESMLGPQDADGDPIGGEVRNIVNLELRQHLTGNLYGALFFDYGNVAFQFEDYFQDFSPGVGFGLRYLLPIGAVRLDTGFNTNPHSGDEKGAIHLSVGMAF